MKNLFLSILSLVLFNNTLFSQSPENTKNSLDYIGVIHNEVLTEYLRQYKNQNMSIDEILSKIKPIILEN